MKFSMTRTRKRWPFNTGDCMGRYDCNCFFFFFFLSKNHLNTIHHPFIFGKMSDDVTEKLFHLIVLYTIVLG